MAPDTAPLRVVQWATGNIGARSLRGIMEHPHLELVGVWVHDQAKVGVDAGELAGVEPCGPVATNSVDAVLALGADCVLYMPRALDADVLCRILASGANVVTTRGEFHHPPTMDPELRTPVEAACSQGGTSIHSTGVSPGFITEAVPLVFSSIQRRLGGIRIEEYADLSPRNSPELLFEVMGFGRPPTAIGPERLEHGRTSFGPSLCVVADALGTPLDGLEAGGAMAVARRDVEIAAGPIAAGTVGAQRISVTGLRSGQPFLQFTATWYCTTDIEADWHLGATGWRVVVDGDAPLDVAMPFPVTLDEMAATTPSYTANRAVNAVAPVCAAPPGIRPSTDLPPLVARGVVVTPPTPRTRA
ncbi:dihydrodipicolinate reductase [Candidatus Poriferisocius sp.]|uniref:NAD(P)H-dependent amine dehydrogenase family protein n=1 Tax=Candidatus Poriferisocius sp. TaxID=3101276 RepID=UPI003B5A9FCC